MRIKKIVFPLLFFVFGLAYSQLDDTHYFPPLKDVTPDFEIIDKQAFYISTPVSQEFNVIVYQGSSTTPLVVLEDLSNINPLKYTLPDGTNDLALVSHLNTGVVLSNSGLRFVSENGEKFYVNYRCKSEDHAGSLTCKGRKALGTNFRWGGIPSSHNNNFVNNYISIMASEDNTKVSISDYDKECLFRLQNDSFGITDDVVEVVLNKNESFVLEILSAHAPANLTGWLGAKIESTKPIAINSGGFVSLRSFTGDLAIDQIVPTSIIGQQYGFIRGNGDNESEFPILVGTKDNTLVYVNGGYYATIDDGDYLSIPGSFYSGQSAGANMFVESNKKIYAFQCLTGEANKIQTLGMNFIPPLVCLLPNSFDHISQIEDIAGTTSKASAITIIADKQSLDDDIKVYSNDTLITKPSPLSFSGNEDWKSFFINNLTGDIKVESTSNVVVGFFVNDGGNAGFAGYFSGFDLVPDTEVELAVEGECLPDGIIQLRDSLRPSYQWYKDGVEMAGATSYKVQIDGVGLYVADIITDSGCVYKSESIDIEDPDKSVFFDTCIPNRTIIAKDTTQSGYQWYFNDSLLKNENNYRLDSLVPGTYYTDIITSGGCVYQSDKYLVLDDVPDSKIDSVYIGSGCIQDSVVKLFKQDVKNYYQYQWYKNGTKITGATSKEYVLTDFGEYYTDIIIPDGCIVKSDTISVQLPVLEIERDVVYGCVPNGNLKALDTLQRKYQWYRDGVKIPDATHFRVDLDSIGVYYTDITTPYGCTYRSDSLEIIHCYDLEIKKTANKTEILEGPDNLIYNINVTNTGYLPVTSLTIQENIPDRLSYDNHITTNKGVWDLSNSTWSIDVLDPNQTVNLSLSTISFVENDTIPVINLISSLQNETDSEYTPDDLTEQVEVINGEIEITEISAELERPYRIIQGDVLNFTFKIRNVGDILVSNLHLTNNLFESELNDKYVSGDANNDGVLDFNETWIYKASYNITQAQINKLEVVSTSLAVGVQINSYNQYSELEYIYHIDPEFVVPYIDLAIELDGNGPGIYIDEDVDIQLNLKSDEISDVNSLMISSPLPTGLEFLSYSSNIGVYNEEDGMWEINSLKKGSDTNLSIKAKMLAKGDHTVNAEILSFNELDSLTSNNKTSFEFTPLCYRVFNEFSPNDDGINDKLVVQCTGFTDNISLKIFNRVGVLVYENSNYKNEFGGYGNRGVYINKNKRLPNGTYFYVINVNNALGERNGWIYINR